MVVSYELWAKGYYFLILIIIIIIYLFGGTSNVLAFNWCRRVTIAVFFVTIIILSYNLHTLVINKKLVINFFF